MSNFASVARVTRTSRLKKSTFPNVVSSESLKYINIGRGNKCNLGSTK